MRPSAKFHCLFVAAFLTITPYTPQHFLEMAKRETGLGEKITLLRRLIENFPLDPTARAAREQLIALLAGSNRYEEALREYSRSHAQSQRSDSIDFKLIEYLLKTGRYEDVLRVTAAAPAGFRDFIRDEHLMEFRVQALLARGQYRTARDCVQRWLAIYAGDGIEGSRFEGDVREIQFLERHLMTLVRLEGIEGKALFTAAVPDSLQHWSKRREVPIVFFKLVPAHPSGQIYEPMLPGRHESDSYFKNQVEEMNRGFAYLSGGAFSLAFKGLDTLYVKEGDMDPISSGGNLLTSRVYVHTIPQLYDFAGQSFAVLVDYREQADGEAAYMGDGIIHISAQKLQTMVLMHEILHGLGATHQEWDSLEGQGHQFDPEDRGLMTFEKGELRYMGLEEKNRALLGWPQVAVVRLNDDLKTASASAAVDSQRRVAASAFILPGLN